MANHDINLFFNKQNPQLGYQHVANCEMDIINLINKKFGLKWSHNPANGVKTIGDIITETGIKGDLKCTTKKYLQVEVHRDYNGTWKSGWFLEYLEPVHNVQFLLILSSADSKKYGNRFKLRLVELKALTEYLEQHHMDPNFLKKYSDREYFEYSLDKSSTHVFLGDFKRIGTTFDTDTFLYGSDGKLNIKNDIVTLGYK